MARCSLMKNLKLWLVEWSRFSIPDPHCLISMRINRQSFSLRVIFLLGGLWLANQFQKMQIGLSPLAKRYEIVGRVVASMWKLWSKDYLAQLQTQYKWQYPSRNVEAGDVVILQDPSSTPNSWLLAKVIEVFPDVNGFVCAVDVLSDSSIRRCDISTVEILLNLPVQPRGVC